MEYSKKLFNGMIVTINESQSGVYQAQVTPNFVNYILKKNFQEAEKAFKLHWDFYLNSVKEEDVVSGDGKIYEDKKGSVRGIITHASGLIQLSDELAEKEAEKKAKGAKKNIISTSNMPTSGEVLLDNAGDLEKAAGRGKWLLRKLGRRGEAKNPDTIIDMVNPIDGDGDGGQALTPTYAMKVV